MLHWARIVIALNGFDKKTMARLKSSLRLNTLCHNRKQTTREMFVGYKVTAPGFSAEKFGVKNFVTAAAAT